jgi:hypothetical protein
MPLDFTDVPLRRRGSSPAAATGPWRRARGRTDSGEARGGAAQCVAWEAQVSREGLGTFARC